MLTRWLEAPGVTQGEQVIAFIEKYCRVPEGTLWATGRSCYRFKAYIILGNYDSVPLPRRVIVSMGARTRSRA